MKIVATLLICTLALAVNTAPSQASSVKFPNCNAMHGTYPGGVSKSSKSKNMKRVSGKLVVASSAIKPKVSVVIYKANKGLDRDGDGIVCEK